MSSLADTLCAHTRSHTDIYCWDPMPDGTRLEGVHGRHHDAAYQHAPGQRKEHRRDHRGVTVAEKG